LYDLVGIIATLPDASNPTSILTILAQKLPEASSFFLTYAILQGLAGSAGSLLQIVPLVLYYVKLYILGRWVSKKIMVGRGLTVVW
jgi:hypothetical protein